MRSTEDTPLLGHAGDHQTTIQAISPSPYKFPSQYRYTEFFHDRSTSQPRSPYPTSDLIASNSLRHTYRIYLKRIASFTIACIRHTYIIARELILRHKCFLMYIILLTNVLVVLRILQSQHASLNKNSSNRIDSEQKTVNLSSIPIDDASIAEVEILYSGPDPNVVLSSTNDHSKYNYFQLSNGLSVLLVTKPTTSVTSVSLSVGIGYYADFAGVPGVAHFTEHMLFMGSDMYPVDDEFLKFVRANGGQANAYTKEEETNFYFQIPPSALHPTLDRFSRFFIAPKFAKNALYRELLAVNNEHFLHFSSDDRRRYQILAQLASSTSPMHQIGAGDLGTLNVTHLHKHIETFFRLYYTAQRMKLVIIAPSFASDFTSHVSHLFSDLSTEYHPVPYSSQKFRRNRPFPSLSIPSPSIVYSAPIHHSNILVLYFTLPSQRPFYRASPTTYISYILSSKGAGSLYDILKRNGLITFLQASLYADSSVFAVYHVRMGLTNAAKINLQLIINSVFQYLALLDQEGIQQIYHDEILEVANITYLYPPSSTTVLTARTLSSRMHCVQIVDLLLPPERRYFDPNLIHETLQFLNPHNMVVLFSSKDNPTANLTLIEPFFNTNYAVRSIPTPALQLWSESLQSHDSSPCKPLLDRSLVDFRLSANVTSANDEEYQATQRRTSNSLWCVRDAMKVPAMNIFLPKQFSLVPFNETSPTRQNKSTSSTSLTSPSRNTTIPMLLRSDEQIRVWYRRDYIFRRPKTYLNMELRAAVFPYLKLPELMALVQLYVASVVDSFADLGSQAKIATFTYTIEPVPRGIRLSLQGFSDTLPLVFRAVMHHILHPTITLESFQDTKTRLLSNRDNIFLNMQPYEYTMYCSLLISERDKYPDGQITSLALEVTFRDIVQFIPEFLANCFIEFFGYGNIGQVEIYQLASEFLHDLNTTVSHNTTKWKKIHEFSRSLNTTTLLNSSLPMNTSLAFNVSYPSSINQTALPPLSVDSIDSSHVPSHLAMKLPPGRYLFQDYTPLRDNPNSATFVSLFSRYRNLKHSTLLLLLHSIMQPYCFAILRTQMQLGYHAQCLRTIHYNMAQSLDISVQGEGNAAYMDEQIEAMLNQFKDILESMTISDFENRKTAAIKTLLTPPESMERMAIKDWSHIVSLDWHFRRDFFESKILSNVTLPMLQEFYNTEILSSHRRRLSIEVFGFNQQRRSPSGGASPTYILTQGNLLSTKNRWHLWKNSLHHRYSRDSDSNTNSNWQHRHENLAGMEEDEEYVLEDKEYDDDDDVDGYDDKEFDEKDVNQDLLELYDENWK